MKLEKVVKMGEEKNSEPQNTGYEPMFVMLAYLTVLITVTSCIYKLMG